MGRGDGFAPSTWQPGHPDGAPRDAYPLTLLVGVRAFGGGGGLFKPVAMGPNEVEDAAAEFNSRVQIVSVPSPRPKSEFRSVTVSAANVVGSSWTRIHHVSMPLVGTQRLVEPGHDRKASVEVVGVGEPMLCLDDVAERDDLLTDLVKELGFRTGCARSPKVSP